MNLGRNKFQLDYLGKSTVKKPSKKLQNPKFGMCLVCKVSIGKNLVMLVLKSIRIPSLIELGMQLIQLGIFW